ncbi:MAG: isoprenylcysteine carboxylmethyltransferase family protein [Halobacteria archaeon]
MQSYVHAHQAAYNVLAASIVAWIAIEMVRGSRQSEKADEQDNRLSTVFLRSSVIGGIVLGFFTSHIESLTIAFSPFWFYVFGLSMIWIGIAYRWYAVRYLGKYFSFDLETQEDHEVVDTGPYNIVRNPSYTGALISAVGIGLALDNYLSLVLVTIGSIVGYAYRIRVEEEVLLENLGEDYEDYMEETPYRLIPYVW